MDRFDQITVVNNEHEINQVQENDIIDRNESGETYLNSFIVYSYQQKVTGNDALELIDHFKTEQYETETVDID